MNENSELWREYKAHGQAKRARNRENSAAVLDHHGVTYHTSNGGAHLIVTHAEHTVDLWPGTGKFIFRHTRLTGRGVFRLLKLLGVTIK